MNHSDPKLSNAPWHPSAVTILNRRNNVAYSLIPASDLAPTAEQLANLVSACNQRAIYSFIFEDILKGQPYSLENANKFFSWAASGWQEQTHFVFVILAPSGLIAAALDIKSNDKTQAEIGYWCSEEHHGLMSNAVAGLKMLAFNANFSRLWARVRKVNTASIKVLENNGFVSRGDWAGDASRLMYEVVLTPPI